LIDEDGFVSKETILKVGHIATIGGLGVLGAVIIVVWPGMQVIHPHTAACTPDTSPRIHML